MLTTMRIVTPSFSGAKPASVPALNGHFRAHPNGVQSQDMPSDSRFQSPPVDIVPAPRKARKTPELDAAAKDHWFRILVPAIQARFERASRRVNPVVEDLGISPQCVKRILGLSTPVEPGNPFVPGPVLYKRVRTSILAAQSTEYRAKSGLSLSKRIAKTQLKPWQDSGLPALRILMSDANVSKTTLANYLGVSPVVLGTLSRAKKPGRPTQGVFDKMQELAAAIDGTGDTAVAVARINRPAQPHVNTAGTISRRKVVSDVRGVLGTVPLDALPTQADYATFVGAKAATGWSKTRCLYEFMSTWLKANADKTGILPGIPELKKRWSEEPSGNRSELLADPKAFEQKELHNAMIYLVYEGRLINRGSLGHVIPRAGMPELIREKTLGEQAIERLHHWLEYQRLVPAAGPRPSHTLEDFRRMLSLDKHQSKLAVAYWLSKGRLVRRRDHNSVFYQLPPIVALTPANGPSLSLTRDILAERLAHYQEHKPATTKGFPALVGKAIYDRIAANKPFPASMSDVSHDYFVNPVVAHGALKETFQQLEADERYRGRYQLTKTKGTWVLEAKQSFS